MWYTTRFNFGPITSILYVNDITTTSNVLDFILFADNTTFLYSHENIENQIDTVNTELKEVISFEQIRCHKNRHVTYVKL